MIFFPYPVPYVAIVMAAAQPQMAIETTSPAAMEVVDFWRDAGPPLWFAKNAAFDARFRDRFLALHERAARGDLNAWADTPDGALALLILLDQFPRNAFRGTPRMYATDRHARTIAHRVVASGRDRAVDPALRQFIYLPFGHSENLADQQRSVRLFRQLGGEGYKHAQRHHDIVARFGRFPHRNPILGRPMRPEEQAYLDNGGFKG